MPSNLVIQSRDKLCSSTLINQINHLGAKRVILQLPEGLLRPDLLELVKHIKITDKQVFISGDACWGGCDMAIDEAIRLKCDLIVHFGHSPYPQIGTTIHNASSSQSKPNIPIIWVEIQSTQSIQNILEDTFQQVKSRLGSQMSVGLVAPVQHVHQLAELQGFLEDRGVNVYLGATGVKTRYPGQILGCTTIKMDSNVEAYVYLGEGIFHGLNVSLSTGKPVLHADPFIGSCNWLDNEVNRLLKKRYALIEASRDAKKWGVILGLRSSQFKPNVVKMVQEWLDSDNRESFSITLRDITGDRIMAFSFLDAFVVTACPRIPIDDSDNFIKPVLNVYELGVLLGKNDWTKYKFY